MAGIVLTSSSTGAFGRLAGTNYAAAKAAMLGLAKAMAHEGRARHQNQLHPAGCPFRKRGAVAQGTDRQAGERQITEKTGPEQVAPIVAWLASNACTVSGEAYSARTLETLVAVADGWIRRRSPASAEDIADHLADPRIFQMSLHSAIDELGEIAAMRRGIAKPGG